MNLSILMSAFIADRLSKEWAKKNLAEWTEKEAISGRLYLKRVRNYGLPNNVLSDRPELVIKIVSAIMVCSTLFAALFLRNSPKAEKAGFSLMLGGGLSNLADRYFDGYVTDFISFKKGKTLIFNLADFCIFFGTLIVTTFSIFRKS